MEEWKNIEGYEGLYQISNYGRVKSFPRNGTIIKERILRHNITASGYHKVHLSKSNVKRKLSVARLVGFAFPEICGEWFEGAQINHLNENKDDNRADNLRWVSKTDNYNWGTRIKRVTEKNINGKCSKAVECYTLDGEYIATYPSLKEAERQTGIDSTLIGRCCKGTTNKYGKRHLTAGGYKWQYKEKGGA